MAVGDAYAIYKKTGKKVCIGKSTARPAQSPMYKNLDFLEQDPCWSANGAVIHFESFTGKRPYIDYRKSSSSNQVLFPDYRPKPGVIQFTEEEKAQANQMVPYEPGSRRIYVEPHVKGTYSDQNKRWPWEYWIELVRELKAAGHQVVQLSRPELSGLPFIPRMGSEDVRVSLAAMRACDVLVCSEGLLHHAAAALKVPAVVIWGARTDPKILGYEGQLNLTSGTDYCGSRTKCQHCQEAMDRITPAQVQEAIEDLL